MLAVLAAAIALPGDALAANAVNINMALPSSNLSLTGVIAKTGGAVVPGAAAVLINPDTGFATLTVITDSTGTYRFWDVPNGTYELGVDPHEVAGGAGAQSMPGYYQASDGTHFSATEAGATKVHYGGTLLHLSVTVPKGYTISGKVSDQSGAPLKGMQVAVSQVGSPGVFSVLPAAFTDAHGDYVVPGIANGNYQVQVIRPSTSTANVLGGGCYKSAPPHNYAPDCAQATAIPINNANAANKTVELPRGHKISGTVKDLGNHNLCAAVTAQLPSFPYTTFGVGSGCGTFTIIAVPSGEYTLLVTPSGASRFVGGYYADNSRHWVEYGGTPKTVHVGASDVTDSGDEARPRSHVQWQGGTEQRISHQERVRFRIFRRLSGP